MAVVGRHGFEANRSTLAIRFRGLPYPRPFLLPRKSGEGEKKGRKGEEISKLHSPRLADWV